MVLFRLHPPRSARAATTAALYGLPSRPAAAAVGAPFALHVALGGFVGSSFVIVWAFLAVLTALLFGSSHEAIGWFVAFSIVTQKHGGELRMESRPGSTRFIVRLPITRRETLAAGAR